MILCERQVAVPWVHIFALAGAGGIFPFSLGGETIGFDIHPFASKRTAQEVGAPVGKGVSLLPAHTHHRVIVIAAMGEVETHVWFIIRIVKIVNPGSGVGINVDYICVHEVKVAGKTTCDGLADYLTVVIDIGCIL